VVGFAARQTLANAVAGVLAGHRPADQIGDLLRFEGEMGVVEDVRLTYSYLRAEDGRRIIVPNERPGLVHDRELHDRRPTRGGRVAIGLPAAADPARSLKALGEIGEVEVAAMQKDGYQILVRTARGAPSRTTLRVAARIRAACLKRLKRENILGQDAA